MAVPFFQVIFRACDAVTAVHQAGRPFGLDKKTLIKVCFKSLYESLQGQPHKILILGDKLSDEMMDFFRQYPVELTNGNYGNEESIRQSIQKAIACRDEDWVYFCEDDYLHRPETFRFISNFIVNRQAIIPQAKKRLFNNRNHDLSQASLCFFPADYPDRYWPEDREPVYIFQSPDCHWRQVANVTFTFLMQAGTVKNYRTVFEHSATGANDGYLSNQLFRRNHHGRKNLCLSPLPGLGCHMHSSTLTPLVDWEALVQSLLHSIEAR